MKIRQQTYTFWIALALVMSQLGRVSAAAGASVPEKVILYVRPGCSGTCLSWANACALQTALGLARSGFEIWVAAGEYKPGTSSLDRTVSFRLKSGVELYGGFTGTETIQGQRDWTVNPTILSGDINNDGQLLGNAYHVVNATGLTKQAVLDGFIVSNGNADADPIAEIWGGGMYAENSLVTIRNVIYKNNFARLGAGLFIHADDQPVFLENVLFTQNEALHSGGGFYTENGTNLTLIDVNFSNNSAGISGGGMTSACSDPKLINVSFLGNSAGSCGGMSNSDLSSPTLTQVTFEGNSADENGGGMCNSPYTSPTLNQVSFFGNRALYGGGMSNFRSSPLLTNVTFFGNSANEGGGIFSNFSAVTLINVTFNNNTSVENGGALSAHWFSGLELTNVIVWGNTLEQIFNEPISPSQIVVTYSDIQGGCTGCTGDHNIDADPNFVDASSGNLRLRLDSPAIDAGNNDAVPLEVMTDLDGNLRFVDIPEIPDSGVGNPTVDMGAYEAHPPRIYLPLILY